MQLRVSVRCGAEHRLVRAALPVSWQSLCESALPGALIATASYLDDEGDRVTFST
jgi:hypothetical protein